MADPPSPSYPALFFLFYPARRRSDRWAINELKHPSFFLVSLWLSLSDALPPASPSPLHHPSYPSHNPHSGDRVFSLVLFSSSSNFSSLFFSSTHVHFFSLPASPVFRPFHSFRSLLRLDLSISISHSLPFPAAFSSPLSFSSTYLLHLLRLSSFSSSNSPFHGREKRTGSCPSRTLFYPAFLCLPSFGLSDPAASLSFSSSLSLQRGLDIRASPASRRVLVHAHAAAYVHLTCTCTHADPAFRVLASPDKSRWRLHVGDIEGRGKREKGRESERERECERGCWSEGVGCIMEAHALELDEHLSLHIRVSIFFLLTSGTFAPFFSLPLAPVAIPFAISPFLPFSLAFYFKRVLG